MGLTTKQRNWLERRRSKLTQSHQIQKKNVTLSLRKEESQHTRGMRYFCNNVALADKKYYDSNNRKAKKRIEKRERRIQTNKPKKRHAFRGGQTAE